MARQQLTNPWPWKIPLHGRADGLYVLVDPQDYRELIRYRWSMNGNGYAERHAGCNRKVLMHRQILGLVPGDGLQGDHENLDKLDCRRFNLRVTTHAQNGQNRPVNRTHAGGPKVSQHRGVTFRKNRGKWVARVMVGGKNIYVGSYDTEEEAADAAARARVQHLPWSTEPVPATV